MNIAVLSDIHSNHPALTTCLAHAISHGADGFWFLGDYVSDCAYPDRTMTALFELSARFPCEFIRGNREDYLLSHHKGADDFWHAPSSASGSLLYTYENLTPRDLDFFATLPLAKRVDMGGLPSVTLCHGSPEDTRGQLAPDTENAKHTLDALPTPLLLCGHTHQQGVFAYAGKRLLNPGAVGIPWGYGGKCQYAMLSAIDGVWRETLYQLDYPREQTIAELHESGLSAQAGVWARLTEHALKTGVDLTTPCLQLALEICQLEHGHAQWRRLPENCWEKAAKRFGL